MPVVNPSAPAYEPEKWNSTVTPEKRDSFFADFRTPILNILIRERSPRSNLDEPNRKMVGSMGEGWPERRGWDIQAALDAFFKNEKYLRDDAKLAEYAGLDEKGLKKFREAAGVMQRAYSAQEAANCLVYAMNDHPDSPAKTPGHAGERPRSKDNAKDPDTYRSALMADVVADGAIDGGPDAKPREGYYRVAVYSMYNPTPKGDNDNVFDMHFVRENRDGGWSHKFGSNPVTTKDKSGNDIVDPVTADLGPYRFLSYVYVPEGGLAVGPNRPPALQMNGQAQDIDALTAQVLESMRKPPESAPAVSPAQLAAGRPKPVEYGV